MGNVLAASPTNPSSSSNVTSMPPPPPLTASPPIEEKPQSAEKKSADNNPGTYEELHKACKGRFSWRNAQYVLSRLRGFSGVLSYDYRRSLSTALKKYVLSSSDIISLELF